MSDKKTIQFNPDLFSFSTNKTRKKKSSENAIKIRTENSAKKKLDTIKKRSILKMIRQHQEQNYQKILGKDISNEKKKTNEALYNESFNSNFENSKQFLDNLVNENSKKEKSDILNRTLKSYQSTPNSLLYDKNSENVSLEFPTDISQTFKPTLVGEQVMNNMNINKNIMPKYGCLKGGSLPTYRNWINKTQKSLINEPIIINNPNNNFLLPIQNSDIVEKKIDENLKRISEIQQTSEKLQQIKRANQKKKMKQKKTIRRTYKTGKSMVLPKISVLVSNRTIRNNITTSAQLLKQIPIEEVKQYLIKHGLIRVGTIAPNDVLRKMYESSLLICGEVQNHNPDNLLYNFLNQ